MNKIEDLIREFLKILEKREVSDNGREFSPTTINSCRCMDLERIGKILEELRIIVAETDTEKCPKCKSKNIRIDNRD